MLDEFAPNKKVTKREFKLNHIPWISKEILQQCRERNKLLKSVSKENDPALKNILYTRYKTIRNIITQRKRESKTIYYTHFFEKNKAKSSEIWKGIRSLVNIKSSTNKNINLLDNNNNNNNNDLLNNSLKITNRFNDYFSTIGSSIEKVNGCY